MNDLSAKLEELHFPQDLGTIAKHYVALRAAAQADDARAADRSLDGLLAMIDHMIVRLETFRENFGDAPATAEDASAPPSPANMSELNRFFKKIISS